MISLDKSKCVKCYKCFRMMEHYCISLEEGFPVFDHSLCNLCQKCVAICPAQAILVNGKKAEKIPDNLYLPSPEQVLHLLEKRRSIKHFKKKELEKSTINQIIEAAKWAPNQNKNIALCIVNSQEFLKKMDEVAFGFVKKWHKILFGFPLLTAFFKLFADDLDNIRRKMEYEINYSHHVLKKNTQALIILHGPKRIPVTERSSHYLAANMIFMAESLGIGACLMDSFVHTLMTTKSLKKELNIQDDVLGVLALGYSDEGIINIPRGYELLIQWKE